MKKLNYKTLEEQGYDGYLLKMPRESTSVRRGNFSPRIC